MPAPDRGGKTRTTSAHGPAAAKKPFKAAAASKPFPSKPRPSGAAPPTATSSSTPAGSWGTKRKADEEKEEEPEKRVVANSLLNAPEEIDFPRGGGTNLTQVEVYEAQLEGDKEARDEDAVSVVFAALSGLLLSCDRRESSEKEGSELGEGWAAAGFAAGEQRGD